MRRRRNKLQVSTFPFLAVLLCAMGSLILVLLIFDRRAQNAARARVALKAAEQQRCADDAAKARDLEEQQRRAAWQAQQDKTRADWAAQQKQVHDDLTAEQRELQNRQTDVARQKEAAAAALQAEEERAAELRRQLAAERDRLLADEKNLTSRKLDVAQAAEQQKQQKAGLAQAEADLINLEETVKAIKAAREKEASTFSVVPYRGKHGDSRRPLYVECTRQGLIFHPDKLQVAFPTIPDRANPQALSDALTRTRDEVLRRVAQQRAASAPGTEATGGYLLFLVRPDGITTYDMTQAALRGQPVEFGYEFVEADWIFEFPADGQSATQPWMTTRADNPPELGSPYPRTAGGNTPGGTGQPSVAQRSAGTGANSGQSGSTGPQLPPTGPGGSVTGLAAQGNNATGAPSGGGVPRYQAVNLAGPQGLGTYGPGGGVGSNGTPGGGNSGLGTSGPNALQAPGAQGIAGSNGGAGSGPSIGLPGPTLPDNRLVGNQPGPPNGPPGQGGPNAQPNGANAAGQAGVNGPGVSGSPIGTIPGGPASPPDIDGAMPRQPPATIAPPTTRMPELFARDVPTPANMQSGNPTNPPNGSTSSIPVPQALAPLPGQSAAPAGSTAAAAGNAPGSRGAADGQVAQAPGQYAGQPTGAGGNAGTGDPSASGSPTGATGSGDNTSTGPNMSLPAPAIPKLPGQTPTKPAAQTPRPVRLAGDRQWILYVECRADGVVLHPSLRSFSAASLAQPQGLADLTRAAQMLLDRRQNTANQLGDKAFKMQIRFLVWPDGERTFHSVYPALDGLPAPKTWQMLRPDDDVDRITTS